MLLAVCGLHRYASATEHVLEAGAESSKQKKKAVRIAIRAPWEQDLGRACRYSNNSDRYPLPTVLIGKKGFQSLLLPASRTRASEQGLVNPIWRMQPDPRMRYKGKSAAELRKRISRIAKASSAPGVDTAPNLSPFYREWYEPVQAGCQAHFDAHASDDGIGVWVNNPRRFLLVGRPQIGKTGAFLWFIHLLWQKCGSQQKLVQFEQGGRGA